MNLQPLWDALELGPVGDFIASSAWAFPTLECLHVIAIVTVFGTVAIMDMRLLGLASNNNPVTELSKDTLTFTWIAFVVAAITGSLLFMSKAHIYVIEPWFLWKMSLIVVAGVNMMIFHFFTWRSVVIWDNGRPPTAAKVAGLLSILLWIVIVFCARLIGFTLGQYE